MAAAGRSAGRRDGYDDNNTRAKAAPAATRSYCYDAPNELAAERAATGCTAATGDEVNAHDASASHTSATVAGSNLLVGADGRGDREAAVPGGT